MLDPYNAEWEIWLQKWFIRLLIPAILVNAGGLLIPILEPDGALYATIAKTIARSGDFINLRVEGKDWLDKPHFPFWITAISFRCFGINGFGYKFPALLFWAAGGWYTWRLALSLYGKPVAQLSTLLYVSAAHLVISNNDVRAEPYLTGLVIGSVFHFYKASRSKPGGHLLAGSFLAACAVMTKGPFVMITISGGLLVDWIRTKDLRQFLNPRWWLALLLTGIFIIPELYCLYRQFDLHPGKEVFGQRGVSGIRFFFWDSQFGRFFNTGPIKGSGDPFFYFHTLLWAFLPWSLLLYAAIVRKCRRLGDRQAVMGDSICLGGALISFVIFSLSRFQLPHYLNILFPFFSILAGDWLAGPRKPSSRRILSILQYSIAGILLALLLFLCWLVHFDRYAWIMALLAALAFFSFRLFRGGSGGALPTAIGRSYCIALLAYAFINFCLYPRLLQYQAGAGAGRAIGVMAAAAPAGPSFPPVLMPEGMPVNYSFQFYCPLPIAHVPIDSLLDGGAGKEALVFLPAEKTGGLRQRGYIVEELQSFPNFHVSQLTGEFLNYRTRQATLTSYQLVRIKK